MATVIKQALINAPVAMVWDALRDMSALHTRLCPGFVVATEMDGDARIVTFGNGATARERIINVDDQLRRLAYSATGGRLEHHNASSQVVQDGEACTFTWTADFLPDAMEDLVSGMMDAGMATMKRTLEAAAADQLSVSA
jgi:hypothetical protein